jgi:hypothetical protein
MGEARSEYSVLVTKHEKSTPRERPRSRWEDNIKKDLNEGRLLMQLAKLN